MNLRAVNLRSKTPQAAAATADPLFPVSLAAEPAMAQTSSFLRRVLVGSDALAIAACWWAALVLLDGHDGTGAGLAAAVAAITGLGLILLASQELYLGRVCRVRELEVSRLARVSVLASLIVNFAGGLVHIELSPGRVIVTCGLMWVALCQTRCAYSAWLGRQRTRGLHTRPVVIAGSNDEARSIERHLAEHPELGFTPVAIVSSSSAVTAALAQHKSDSVILVTSAFGATELNRLTRRLLSEEVHLHLSWGLSGIDHRRLRAQPLAREPMFYIERLTVSPWQLAVKRVVDVIGSVVGLVLTMPILALAAIAIKLDSPGPVLFRHERIGREGRPFTVYKLRTMVADAASQLHLILADNQRRGPLFKSHNDPRVTRVGRWLRAFSIDELPQLLNVLMGTMSLVGPRPALAHEVAQFDDDLRDRHRVRPGITGLWQIEGRDDPSFDSYRRLDLFYMDNWSLELDFVILLTTARAVAVQAIRDIRRKWRPGAGSARSKAGEIEVFDLSTTTIEVSPTPIELLATGGELVDGRARVHDSDRAG
jgi:exopolysaccharide biosynthesis polyprenyl glycosylphosphotransferase